MIRWPDSSFECIFNEAGGIVTNPLVMGTFNFKNEIIGHWTHDVFPYIFWGNTYSDPSKWYERVIWDSGSAGFRNNWRFLRHEDLYDAYDESLLLLKAFGDDDIEVIINCLGNSI